MKKFLLGLIAVLASTTTFAAESQKVTLTKDNVIVMNTYFDSESVANLAQKAKEIDAKLPSGDPIYLVLDTGGGSIEAGIEAIENLNNLNRPINTISLFAASMGFQTVEGVKGERLVTTNGTLMSHKARGRFGGEFPGQLDSRYSHYLKRVLRLDAQVVARTSGKHTAQSYASLIENEYWCDGQDCIDQGLADRVVAPSCDASLNGTHEQLYDRFMYMGIVVEIVDLMADCPLITGALSWQVYIDGEPLFENYKKKDEEKKETEPTGYGYYASVARPISKSLLDKVGVETAENIKRQVTKKMDARSELANKEIRRY